VVVRYLEDPGQTRLFDVFADILSPTAYQKLRKSWQHLFRSAILNRLPAKKKKPRKETQGTLK
jgi:hypothetical protein